MRLHFPHRRPEPVGRHSRVLTGVPMPGAAAALVSTTVTADSLLAHAAEQDRLQAHDAAVTLGFADGASVELEADDPRVRTFRAAADALLEGPHA